MNTAEDAITMIRTLSPEDRQKVKSYLLTEEGFAEEDYSDADIETILQAGKEIDEGVNIERFSSMKEARKSLGLTEQLSGTVELIFHKTFRKGLEKLTPNQKHRVDQALDLFESNPFHSQLNNHGLKGKLKGFRAVSAGGDLRMIFRVKENYQLVEFVLIGSHNQVY